MENKERKGTKKKWKTKERKGTKKRWRKNLCNLPFKNKFCQTR